METTRAGTGLSSLSRSRRLRRGRDDAREPGRQDSAVGERGGDAAELPGGRLHLPDEARVQQLARRAAGVGDDGGAVRPVVSHDRRLLPGPGRAPAAVRPRSQQLQDLRQEQGQAVRGLQLRRVRHQRRHPVRAGRRGVHLVGRPVTPNWVAFHAETGGYDVKVVRDERSAANQGRRLTFRYQL